MHTKLLLAASAAIVLALPAIAQQAAPAQPAPASGPATGVPAQTPAVSPSTSPAIMSTEGGADESAVEEVSGLSLVPPAPPVEYPGWARRDPWTVGSLGPEDAGLTGDAWGGANGTFLSILMRRMQTPTASRWVHIALRDALLAKLHAPVNVNPVDWVAERAWLLLRLGEADAARMLVAGVDADRFTPKMVQVAVQSALANGDPPALCPLEEGLKQSDPGILRL